MQNAILTKNCEQIIEAVCFFYVLPNDLCQYYSFIMKAYFLSRTFITLLIATFIFIALRLGAGSAPIVTGDEVRMVSHGLTLPSGYKIPDPEPLPVISTDYHEHFINPKSFKHPQEIMSKGLLPKSRMISFLWISNQSLDVEEVEQIVELYIREAKAEGVNHDIAFIQMILETGYLKFGGDVKRFQNNFCGLGAIGNGVAGLSFRNMEEGVRAHIQHLKAYASSDSLRNELVNSRFGVVKRGSATNIHELTGKWATDPLYGKKIDMLLEKIYAGTHIVRNKTSILFD